MSSSSSDGEIDHSMQSSGVATANLLKSASMVLLSVALVEEGDVTSKSQKPRQSASKQQCFDNAGCLKIIKRDHLSPDALFGTEFPLFFRLERSRVELIIQALGNSEVPFYGTFRSNRYGLTGASLEAKVLLPLKVLAYGVAPHAFADYFQMSVSQCGRCCRNFCRIIPQLFKEEYIRSPSKNDLISINKLHHEVHGINGMLGSLDCMHTYWKNCPVGWQQSFKGKEAGPTIVLEAICDYNLWFWHTSYGYAGAMKDLNILNLSPFISSITNGSFGVLEHEAGVVPFEIDNQQFTCLYWWMVSILNTAGLLEVYLNL
jgi:Plant transposon protein